MNPAMIGVFLSALLITLPCFLLASPQFTSLAQQYANAPLISYDVAQDQQGFIWFGSELDGLQRFDGYELIRWEILPEAERALGMANVNQLLLDSQQRLWTSTWGQGITMLDAQRQIAARYHTAAAESRQLPSDRAQSLFEDKQQRIWLGTVEGLRYLENSDLTTLRHLTELQHVRVWQMVQDSDNRLWLATAKGLYSVSADLQKVKHWPLPAFAGATSSSRNPNEIRTLLLATDGIWLGTQLGLFFFNLELGQIVNRYPAEFGVINSLFQPDNSRLWIGSSAGLFQLDLTSTKQTVEHFLQSADIRKFFKDQTGVLWVASRNRGIFKMNPLPQNFKAVALPIKPDLPENSLRRIHSQSLIRDRIWLGLDQELVSYDFKANHWFEHPLPTRRPHNQIQAVSQDNSGNYWVATDVGLFQSSSLEQPFQQRDLPDSVKRLAGITSIATDPDGTLWLGIWEQGLIKWPQQNPEGKLEQYNVAAQPGDTILSIVSDHSDSIWMVTRFSGLFRLQRTTGVMTRYHSAADSLVQLPSDILLCLEKVTDHQFWLCTNQGLFFMDLKQNYSELYQVKQGLPDNRVIAINAQQKGFVWVSTKRGLAQLDLKTKTFKLFTEKANINALLLENRTLSYTDDGDLWVGTAAGLYQWKPSQADDYKFNAPMVISNMIVDQRLWLSPQSSAEQPLELPVNTKEISIQFSYLEYYFTDAHQYQYRFSGLDQEWHSIGNQHHISFSRLPPGHYSFEVRNSLEPTDASTARLHFFIPAPWWHDKRLWLFVSLVALLLVWLAWQARTRTLHLQNIRLNQLVLQRTAALEQANLALNQQARTDFLTRLPNRMAFSEQFELLQRQAIRQKSPTTLALLDIDHFKAINDTYGHDAGDIVLTKVAQNLAQRLRQQDVLARWGGEEFILLLPDTNLEGALVICEELRQSLMQMDILYEQRHIAVTATFGLAFLCDAQLDLTRWQSAADMALYQGKRTGRNKVVAYQPDQSTVT